MNNMKIKLFALFLFVLGFNACSGGDNWRDEALYQRDLAAQRISEELNLEPIGSGGGLQRGVHRLALSFSTHEHWTKSEARSHFLEAYAIFAEQVNSSALVRKHADSDPLGAEQLSLAIHYVDTQGQNTVVSLHYSDQITFRRIQDSPEPPEEFHREALPLS